MAKVTKARVDPDAVISAVLEYFDGNPPSEWDRKLLHEVANDLKGKIPRVDAGHIRIALATLRDQKLRQQSKPTASIRSPIDTLPKEPKERREVKPSNTSVSTLKEAIKNAVAALGSSRSNLVSLVDLKEVVAPNLPIDQFHDVINQLRNEGVLTGSGAEGRFGLSDKEREHLIREDDSLTSTPILYVGLRDPHKRKHNKDKSLGHGEDSFVIPSIKTLQKSLQDLSRGAQGLLKVITTLEGPQPIERIGQYSGIYNEVQLEKWLTRLSELGYVTRTGDSSGGSSYRYEATQEGKDLFSERESSTEPTEQTQEVQGQIEGGQTTGATSSNPGTQKPVNSLPTGKTGYQVGLKSPASQLPNTRSSRTDVQASSQVKTFTASEFTKQVEKLPTWNPGDPQAVVPDVAELISKNGAEEPDVQIHNMAEPQVMKTLTIEDVKYSWSDNHTTASSVATSLVGLVAMREWRWKIPRTLSKHTKHIVFTDLPNKEDAYFQKRMKDPEFKATATAEDGVIVSYNNNHLDPSIYTHEAAHNLAQYLWGSAMAPRSTEDYYFASIEEGPVTEYAASYKHDYKQQMMEDFAEAVSLYITEPQKFKQNFPKKYQALVNLFEELEDKDRRMKERTNRNRRKSFLSVWESLSQPINPSLYSICKPKSLLPL